MKRKRVSYATLTTLMLSILLILSGCAEASTTQQAPPEIVIGASIPESGDLASFGLTAEWGYTTAVNDVNASGGLYLSQYHTKVPVRLIIYDDKSSGDQGAANIERLVKQDKVSALLGSATPPLVIPGGLTAEKEHVPMVTGLMPIRAFLGGNPHWNYTWDIFFDELNMTQQQFLTMNTVPSNRKVALFTDTEQDGIVMGGLWEKNAVKYGYTVVYHPKFPVGTKDYGDMIRQAQAADAQIVIAQMQLPDAVNLWQQMQKLNYRPAAAFLEKAAETVEWPSVLHGAAQGVMVEGFWYPTLSYPGAGELRQRFELDTGLTYSPQVANTYTVAQVLLDAIERAGNLNPQSINASIAKTNKTYVGGPVNFAAGPAGHTSVMPNFMLQWQHGQTQIVYPPRLATARLIYPLPPWSTTGS